MRIALAYAMLVFLVLGTASGASVAQMQTEQAGRDVVLFTSIFRGVTIPAPYVYLDQAVVDYGQGTFSAAASEQSFRFFTVMEGRVKYIIGDATRIYGADEYFSVPPGVIIRGFNESRTAKARVFVSSIVPPIGAGVVAVPGTRESSPPPTRVYTSRLPVGPLPRIIDVYQVGHIYRPGFMTPLHIMNEAHEILQLEGVNTYKYLDGTVEHYGPGQASPMYVGRPGTMGNTGAVPSAFVLTYLANPGRPLFSPVH